MMGWIGSMIIPNTCRSWNEGLHRARCLIQRRRYSVPYVIGRLVRSRARRTISDRGTRAPGDSHADQARSVATNDPSSPPFRNLLGRAFQMVESTKSMALDSISPCQRTGTTCFAHVFLAPEAGHTRVAILTFRLPACQCPPSGLDRAAPRRSH